MFVVPRGWLPTPEGLNVRSTEDIGVCNLPKFRTFNPSGVGDARTAALQTSNPSGVDV
jgi:hypothetical protein